MEEANIGKWDWGEGSSSKRGLGCTAGSPPNRGNQSWTLAQAVNTDTDTHADSVKVFLLGCPKACLSGDGVCKSHLAWGSEEVSNKTVEILPLGKAPGQVLNKMRNKSNCLQIFRSRKPDLAELWALRCCAATKAQLSLCSPRSDMVLSIIQEVSVALYNPHLLYDDTVSSLPDLLPFKQ